MKKIMILSAAALAIFLAMPQLTEATTVQNNITVIQEKAVTYKESTPAALPEAAVKILTKDYAGYTVEKIFIGDDGSFKVALAKGTVKSVVFFSATGELVKGDK